MSYHLKCIYRAHFSTHDNETSESLYEACNCGIRFPTKNKEKIHNQLNHSGGRFEWCLRCKVVVEKSGLAEHEAKMHIEK